MTGCHFLENARKDFAYLWVLLVIILLCADPSPYKMVPDRMGKSEVVVSWGSNITIFNQSEMKMPIEAFLNF